MEIIIQSYIKQKSTGLSYVFIFSKNNLKKMKIANGIKSNSTSLNRSLLGIQIHDYNFYYWTIHPYLVCLSTHCCRYIIAGRLYFVYSVYEVISTTMFVCIPGKFKYLSYGKRSNRSVFNVFIYLVQENLFCQRVHTYTRVL